MDEKNVSCLMECSKREGFYDIILSLIPNVELCILNGSDFYVRAHRSRSLSEIHSSILFEQQFIVTCSFSFTNRPRKKLYFAIVQLSCT